MDAMLVTFVTDLMQRNGYQALVPFNAMPDREGLSPKFQGA